MSRVIVEVKGAVAHVQMNRPDKRNGLDIEMFDAIIDAGESLMRRTDIRAVVLSGAGGCFCSGLDFMAFMQDAERSIAHLMDERIGVGNRAQRVGWIWQELAVPVIAAIEGVAFGGGLQIAAGCDIRIIAPDARLSVMEIKWGLIPDMGITKTLAPYVRSDVLRELTWTGRVVEADEALTLGLVTRVSENPVEAALALAADIASKSPHAVVASKALFQQADGLSVADAMVLESERQRPLLGSANQMEAVMANMERRAPQFADRDDGEKSE